MNRTLLIALAALLMTMGCNQANKPESPAKMAAYHVTKKKTCQIASQTTTCYSVTTDATSGEDFTAFTQHFRKQSGDVDALVVTFFLDKPQTISSGSGFAFNNKEAARNILSRSLSQNADLNKAVSKAMQNEGIYVISVEDQVEQQACEDWDPKILGHPPKQWDCSGH
jgi:hypothetical protein